MLPSADDADVDVTANVDVDVTEVDPKESAEESDDRSMGEDSQSEF